MFGFVALLLDVLRVQQPLRLGQSTITLPATPQNAWVIWVSKLAASQG
jgi:hypothetical protein